MDIYDQILVKNSKKYMVRFELERFKAEYPSLYSTIRQSLKDAATQFNQPREVTGEDMRPDRH